MKYAIMGGTFNPIHYGHLFLAEEVKTTLGYDYIIFVPAYRPAHKTVENSDSPMHRYNMVKLAIKPYSYFLCDDCELKRRGTSYMIDTVNEIHNRYKSNETIGLIIGDDLLAQFHKWKNAQELASRVELIVAKRRSMKKVSFNYPHTYLQNKILAISASEIRDRIYGKKSVRFLLPDKVYGYIQKYKLYS